MLDNCDAEALVKIYPRLQKLINVLNNSIVNIGTAYTPTVEFGSVEVYDQLETKIKKKNELLILQQSIQFCINQLKDADKKFIVLSMYKTKVKTTSEILGTSVRNYYRRKTAAYTRLTSLLNKCENSNLIEVMKYKEKWIMNECDYFHERQKAFNSNLEG